MKNYLTAITFALFLITPILADERIAYIDLNYLLKNSSAGKSLISELEKIESKNFKTLNEELEKLKSEEIQIKSKKNLVSESEYIDKIDKFKNKVDKYNNKKDFVLKKFEETKKKHINNLVSLINPFIEEYMSSNNINLLLEKKNIYIAKSNYDITENILEILNNKISSYDMN